MNVEEPRIGVYVCHCGTNIAGLVDVNELKDYASKLPYVVIARDYEHVCSDVGQQMIKNDIKELGINRVVIAACSPRLHELTFRDTLKDAGLNPFLLEIANIREQCSWMHGHDVKAATEKAKDLVRMAVAKAAYLKPLQAKTVGVEKSCLVIGGGIAGIQASLDLADMGFKVYLVEKEPSIGGRMAQWGKVFPTMDCSACILTPKMVSAAKHPNIELLTLTEVESIRGFAGNFEVTLVKKPRYVDVKKCTACGECAKKCPVTVPNEFDFGLSNRKAIYIPFPQATPTAYVIDGEHCLYLTKGICKVCERFCKANAIDFNQKPEKITIKVGAIIVATGFDPFDPSVIEQFGYGIYKNVITGPMLERMSSVFGPTGGKIVRPSDGKEPNKVAFILCVGSRDLKYNKYCSRVCCMYTIKDALILKEQNPNAYITIFYMDIRAFGKGYEEFYIKAQESGIRFVRGRVAEIREDPKTKDLTLIYEDTLLGKKVQDRFDMVVLAVGMVPRKEPISQILGIPRGVDGFLMEAHPKLRPHDTPVDGIFIAGAAQYPKDIADTVAQASGTAARAAALLNKGFIELEPITPTIDEDKCSACRLCEITCPFNALELIEKEGRKVMSINEVMCKGCGACATVCPNNAIKPSMFTNEQLLAQVEAALTTLTR